MIILYILEKNFHHWIQAFSTEEISKRHVKDYFKTTDKHIFTMPKKGKHVKFTNYEKKGKVNIYNLGKFWKYFSASKVQKSYTNKYQKHIGCSYGFKLICVDDKFSKPYFGEDSVYKFVNSMIKERKSCKELIKKHFNKGLLITKKKMIMFWKPTNCWICDNDYVDNDVKVRDHCDITEKYTGSAHRDCNANIKLNHKVSVIFHNLKMIPILLCKN